MFIICKYKNLLLVQKHPLYVFLGEHAMLILFIIYFVHLFQFLRQLAFIILNLLWEEPIIIIFLSIPNLPFSEYRETRQTVNQLSNNFGKLNPAGPNHSGQISNREGIGRESAEALHASNRWFIVRKKSKSHFNSPDLVT